MRRSFRVGGCVLLLTVFAVVGCGDGSSSTSGGGGHAHQHNHGDLGPHDGHILELNDATYHVEWLHDDPSGKLTIYILDSTAKKTSPIAAEAVTISTSVDGEKREYSLRATDASDDATPVASKFEITDLALLTAVKIGKEVEATLTFDVDGKTYTGHFEHDDH